MTASPDTRLLQGQSLTLTLDSSKVTHPSIECKGPGKSIVKGSKTLSMPNLRIQDSGIWTCTVTQSQHKNNFDINISVLGKRLPPCSLLLAQELPALTLLFSWFWELLEWVTGMYPDPSLAEVCPEVPSPFRSLLQQPRGVFKKEGVSLHHLALFLF